MSKQKIREWLVDKLGYAGNLEEISIYSKDDIVNLIHQYTQEQSGWVSVDNRLPDENKSYVVNVSGEGVFEMGFYRCPEYLNTLWHCPITLEEVDVKITHWMPLPLPPTEEA